MRTITFAALLCFSVTLQAQTGPALAVARDFYKWYVPFTNSGKNNTGWDTALRTKRASFDAALIRLLDADLKASAANKDEIVGHDGDPFLNTQDPCERYDIGPATTKVVSVLVQILATCQGKRDAKADVTAELRQLQGKWVFTNFHYPDGGNLIALLAQLRKDRTKK